MTGLDQNYDIKECPGKLIRVCAAGKKKQVREKENGRSNFQCVETIIDGTIGTRDDSKRLWTGRKTQLWNLVAA